MFQSKGDYDRGVNTFSPEGRLFQVEYALEAVKLGSTSVGITTKDGVVLAVEKRLPSSLVVPNSIEKILQIDDHIGCAMSGLSSDARTLVEHARVETQNHAFTYDEPMPVEACVHTIADMALDFSDTGDEQKKKRAMARPFGVALLCAGVDKSEGPCLYQTEPSGTYTKFKAAAIGSAADAATALLVEHYKPHETTLAEAEALALFILRQVMEEKISAQNVELGVARTSSMKFELYSPEETAKIFEKLPAPTVPQL